VFVIVEGFYDIKFYLRADLCKIPASAGGFIHFEVSACPFLRKTVPELTF